MNGKEILLDSTGQSIVTKLQSVTEALQNATAIAGPEGKAATVAIGEVTKGDIASVTNVGTENAAVLNFVLPKGDQGLQGEAGPAGADGAIGPQGPVGETGPQGAAGIDGKDGLNGADGKAATIAVGNVTEGEAVSVKNVGDANAAVFDFVLPRGPKGDIGPAGADGATGPQGEIGPQGPAGEQGPAGADGAQGLPGEKGADGLPGKAATIAVGSVGVGPTVTITNSGTENAAVFDFTFPENAKVSTVTPEEIQAMIDNATATYGEMQLNTQIDTLNGETV